MPTPRGTFVTSLRSFVEAGGGLLFQAGEFYNPRALANTPLEDVLPVQLEDAKAGADFVEEIKVSPTRLGELTVAVQREVYGDTLEVALTATNTYMAHALPILKEKHQANFVVVKQALAQMSPMAFNGLRFLGATIMLLVALRVIPTDDAARAAFFGDDLAVAIAFSEFDFSFWLGNRDRGMEVCLPRARLVFEILKQKIAPVLVFCAGLGRVARGVQPWRTIKRLHFETGIIAQHDAWEHP